MPGPYGTVTDGIWKSRFKVEWSKYLKESVEAERARKTIRESRIGKFCSQVLDDVSLKPFLWADSRLIFPLLCTTDKAFYKIADLLKKCRFVDAQCIWRMDLSKFVKDCPRISCGTDFADAPSKSVNILDLVLQEKSVLTKTRSFLWRIRVFSSPFWRYTMSHLRRTRDIYKQLGATSFEVSDVLEFVEQRFLPQLLHCINNHEKVPAADHWLKIHAAPHVVTLMDSFKSVAIELYGQHVTDNITYQTTPISTVYGSCYVHPDLRVAKDLTKIKVSTANLPSVIVDCSFRTLSDNPPDSPVASGPKTCNVTMAVCLLPNSHPSDMYPLYVRLRELNYFL